MNWKIRLKNKSFWLTIIPALAIALQTILALAGIKVDYTDQTEKLIEVVNAVFVVLMVVGVVNDPTTTGITDSARAKEYHVPNAKK